MEINELHKKCIEVLLKGNLTIDEETGVLSFDLDEDEKTFFIEYAVNMILQSALYNLETK
jgi:hypothetical protein